MVSLFSVILWLCSKCVFDFAVPLCEFPVFHISKEPSEDRRLAAGPEVFRAGLRAGKTRSSHHGPSRPHMACSCSEATGPWRVGLAVESR